MGGREVGFSLEILADDGGDELLCVGEVDGRRVGRLQALLLLKPGGRVSMGAQMAQISLGRMAALVMTTVLLIGGTVFGAATIARNSAVDAARQQSASEQMLTAMVNQETGSRGYFQTRAPLFLEPYNDGTTAFAQALAQSRALAGGNSALERALNDQAQLATRWHADTQTEIYALEGAGQAPTVSEALIGKATMDGFRASNTAYDAQLDAQQNAALSTQTWFAVALAAVLSLALVYVGGLFVRRAAREERQRIKSQSDLRELLQVSQSEGESRMLLVRHIELTVPGSAAVVFNRNNSHDRLEPVIGDGRQETPLRGVELEQLKPRSCMAVRLSRRVERRSGDDTLMQCEVCGKVAGDVACEPLLVGGQVIGSVLIARGKTIGERERIRVRDSVAQAAPILANQRNLALAETRAASDALTGLPNRRAADETLKRMTAHAARSFSPLSAVLLDLDHFKHINDLHGHEQGDKALAAVGHILRSTLRASDFAARYGGEEFLILLPDTNRTMAREVAEKLRRAIASAEISTVGSLTASLGVAAFPDDAGESEQLIRKADRALYGAKAGGRNRVETASPPGVVTVAGGDPISPSLSPS